MLFASTYGGVMSTIIRTLEGCRAAYPGRASDEEVLRDACINNVLSGRGHFAAHMDGLPAWIDVPLQLFLHNPAFVAALIGCAIIWLVLLFKVLGAENLRAPQKWGWAIGLTAIFPVFSVLYMALSPVTRPTTPRQETVNQPERERWFRP